MTERIKQVVRGGRILNTSQANKRKKKEKKGLLVRKRTRKCIRWKPIIFNPKVVAIIHGGPINKSIPIILIFKHSLQHHPMLHLFPI